MRLSKIFVGILAASCVSAALAQTNVGQLLDSGAVKLTAADFKQQIVGRYLVGPGRGVFVVTSTWEVVYLEDGLIHGSGQPLTPAPAPGTFTIEGSWTVDERDRICQSTRAGPVVLAPRCQYWFKQADKYYYADSDTDRSAPITVRTVKKP